MSEQAENSPALWRSAFPVPQAKSHKYTRGTALIRGGAMMTGATRLAARAAQRMGAGLVMLAAPTPVFSIYAEALESVITHPCDDVETWRALVNDKRNPVLLIGPGLDRGAAQKEEVLAALAAGRPTVLDADALTIFANDPNLLFRHLHATCILTPHEGEFARIFGESTGDKAMRALAAARRANCTLLLKGAETIIAAPDGKLIANLNAPPWLATAGSGDVLAGMILGLIAQNMPIFPAAAAAAWLHGRIGTLHGPGLIAEDIVAGIPEVLRDLLQGTNSLSI